MDAVEAGGAEALAEEGSFGVRAVMENPPRGTGNPFVSAPVLDKVHTTPGGMGNPIVSAPVLDQVHAVPQRRQVPHIRNLMRRHSSAKADFVRTQEERRLHYQHNSITALPKPVEEEDITGPLVLQRTRSARLMRPRTQRKAKTSRTPDKTGDVKEVALPQSGLTRSRSEVFSRIPKINLNVENDHLDGVGGSYLVHDSQMRKFIFKPNSEEAFDEEIDANGNALKLPKKKGVKYGETSVKEFAAYILDQGWAGVPPTVLVGGQLRQLKKLGIAPQSIRPSKSVVERPRVLANSSALVPPSQREPFNTSGRRKAGAYVPPFRRRLMASGMGAGQQMGSSADHTTFPSSSNELEYISNLTPDLLTPKFGSLQCYVENIGSAEDVGPSKFSIQDVHRIGVLDIRICNLDRHLGNILVARREEKEKASDYKLVPIDHAYILPDFRHLEEVNFEWLSWRQTKSPFSAETLEYIASLNPFEDAAKLKQIGLEDTSAMTLIITTLFLQHCAKRGMTLWEIGNLVQRDGMRTEKSFLENVVRSSMDRFQREDSKRVKELSHGDGTEKEYRIKNRYDLRWSRKLNLFFDLFKKSMEEHLEHRETEVLRYASDSGRSSASKISRESTATSGIDSATSGIDSKSTDSSSNLST